jgi:hypothetical protein
MRRRYETYCYVNTDNPMLTWQKIGKGKWHWSDDWEPSNGEGASYNGSRMVLKFHNAVRVAHGLLDRYREQYPGMVVTIEHVVRRWDGERSKSRMCRIFRIGNRK